MYVQLCCSNLSWPSMIAITFLYSDGFAHTYGYNKYGITYFVI